MSTVDQFESVFNESKGEFKIGRQSDLQLQIIMRSIFLSYGRNINTDINTQINELNTILEETKNELSTLKQETSNFDTTLEDASSNLEGSVTLISGSIANIEEGSSQLNALLFPIVASIAIILALQIVIIARRR